MPRTHPPTHPDTNPPPPNQTVHDRHGLLLQWPKRGPAPVPELQRLRPLPPDGRRRRALPPVRFIVSMFGCRCGCERRPTRGEGRPRPPCPTRNGPPKEDHFQPPKTTKHQPKQLRDGEERARDAGGAPAQGVGPAPPWNFVDFGHRQGHAGRYDAIFVVCIQTNVDAETQTRTPSRPPLSTSHSLTHHSKSPTNARTN